MCTFCALLNTINTHFVLDCDTECIYNIYICNNQRARQATDRTKSRKAYSHSSVHALLCLNHPPLALVFNSYKQQSNLYKCKQQSIQIGRCKLILQCCFTEFYRFHLCTDHCIRGNKITGVRSPICTFYMDAKMVDLYAFFLHICV